MEQALFEELGATPSPHAVAQRSGIPYPKLMALYKVGRALAWLLAWGWGGWWLGGRSGCRSHACAPRPCRSLPTHRRPAPARAQAFRAPTSRDLGPQNGEEDNKGPGELWVEEDIEQVGAGSWGCWRGLRIPTACRPAVPRSWPVLSLQVPQPPPAPTCPAQPTPPPRPAHHPYSSPAGRPR